MSSPSSAGLPAHPAHRHTHRGIRRALQAAVLALLLLVLPQAARATDLVEESTFFRVTIDGRPVRLQGMIVRRAGDVAKLPMALITHGKSANLGSMLDLQPGALLGPARDLARRGWLAVIVIRRGFGQSDGPMPKEMSCATTSFADRFAADADDLQAAVDVVARRPDADASRMIAIGVSAGGAAVAALGARNPPNLLAVINISGGLRFESCPKEDALVAAFRDFGARSRVPNLWLYANNDTLFPARLVDRMHEAFLDGGGNVKRVSYDDISGDGHSLFSTGRRQWLMEMDAFLRARSLPTWQHRDVDDLMAKLKSKNRGFIEKFIAAPSEKALARSTTSDYMHIAWGYTTMEAARARAIEGCQKQKPGETCTIILENDRWVGGELARRPPGAEPMGGQGSL